MWVLIHVLQLRSHQEREDSTRGTAQLESATRWITRHVLMVYMLSRSLLQHTCAQLPPEHRHRETRPMGPCRLLPVPELVILGGSASYTQEPPTFPFKHPVTPNTHSIAAEIFFKPLTSLQPSTLCSSYLPFSQAGSPDLFITQSTDGLSSVPQNECIKIPAAGICLHLTGTLQPIRVKQEWCTLLGDEKD